MYGPGIANMPIERSVLVLDGSVPRPALAQRLRRLGYRTLRAKCPEDAFRIVEDHRQQVAVALIPPDLAVLDLRAALAALAADAPGATLRYVVAGMRPVAETLTELRAAGADLALWEPFDDARLRFQVNRALASGAAAGPPRRELRAPVEVPAQVFQAGRQKGARTYTVSAAGAYLETLRPALRGAAVEVELAIGPGALRLCGQVTLTNVPGNLQRANLPVGMGLCFEPVPDAAAQALCDKLK